MAQCIKILQEVGSTPIESKIPALGRPFLHRKLKPEPYTCFIAIRAHAILIAEVDLYTVNSFLMPAKILVIHVRYVGSKPK
jgi:hypothetical protein